MHRVTQGLWTLLLTSLLVLSLIASGIAAPSGPPVRIGGTLALTGPSPRPR